MQVCPATGLYRVTEFARNQDRTARSVKHKAVRRNGTVAKRESGMKTLCGIGRWFQGTVPDEGTDTEPKFDCAATRSEQQITPPGPARLTFPRVLHPQRNSSVRRFPYFMERDAYLATFLPQEQTV